MVDFTGKSLQLAYIADFPEIALRPPGTFHGDSGTRLTQGFASGPQSLLWDCSHGQSRYDCDLLCVHPASLVSSVAVSG